MPGQKLGNKSSVAIVLLHADGEGFDSAQYLEAVPSDALREVAYQAIKVDADFPFVFTAFPLAGGRSFRT